jgi:hypothetical protein
MTEFAADVILYAHFAFVLFVVGGFAAIWTGAAAGWRWITNFRFRMAHLVAIVFVAAEALAGVACPWTVWENALRGSSDQASFVARWVHRLLFYNLPEWVFTVAYSVFAVLVAVTFWAIPPKRQRPP